MKSFLTVLKFEFLGLCKEKVYLFSTILMCVVLSLLLFAPRLVQIYDNFVGGSTAQESTDSYALYDPMDIIKEEAFQQAFPKGTLIKVASLDELQQKVESSEVVVGYHVKSDTEYVSYVYNSSLFSSDNQVFEQLMIAQYRNKELTALGSDVGKINQILSTSPISEQVILGKDGRYGYMVAYGMIMFIYILIILYGSMISTKVASEKSNRTMEILVTSSNPNALIFGKVIGVATAGLLQVGIVAFIAYISYQMNITYWGFLGSAFAQLSLPMVFVFLLFGTIGYLLYSFLFGALGALVDKVED
ncbi:MAG: ABC transporter permease, partial [Erysipelotrichaceae bacterium]|nr:ABC transporter permease [Erysipelotrichaceae bacterium]